MASTYMQRAAASGDEKAETMQKLSMLRARIRNQNPFPMTLHSACCWTENYSTFPATIAPNATIHFGDGSMGAKAGVQYVGVNAAGVQCVWVVAWDAPNKKIYPGMPNRVYVVCGPKSDIDAISWNQIRLNLEAAGTEASYTEPANKTKADATIRNLKEGYVDYIGLEANFAINA